MVMESELNADADRKLQEMMELKNRADQLAYSVEKTIRDQGDKISEADKSRIEDKVRALRTAVGTDDQDQIQTAFNDLEQESHQLAEQLYKSASEQAQPSGEEGETVGAGVGGSSASDGDVIDAEFKEEK